MVTSVFEAFPLLYSAMAAGWPILGPHHISPPSPPLSSCSSCSCPGPFTLLNKHHTEITPSDNILANSILMVRPTWNQIKILKSYQEYVGNVSAIKAENLQQITNMFTDSFFSYGISKFLDYYLPKVQKITLYIIK